MEGAPCADRGVAAGAGRSHNSLNSLHLNELHVEQREQRFAALVLNDQEYTMGMLNRLLGASIGTAALAALCDAIEQHGGLQGFVEQFAKKGLGQTARSWVESGPNQPISADQVHMALGSGTLLQLAVKAGLSVPELTQKFAQALPQAIDRLTPNGTFKNQ
jgi:uncharacterized protein YidB (DUF937 family)